MSSAALPADGEPAEGDHSGSRDRVTASFLAAVAQEVGDASLTPAALARAVLGVLPVDGASLSTMVSVLRLPLGASDEVSRRAEELQSTLGEGPCLEAAETQATVVADRAGLEARWPRYAAELTRRTPFRAVAAVPLQAPGHGVFAALDVYSTGPRLSDRLDRLEVERVATAVAALLTVCISQIHDIDAPEAGPDWYRAAAGPRNDVWVAIGMVMATRAIRTRDALSLLRARASVESCTLDDVATDLVQGRLHVADLAGPPLR
ncbi:MAG TPA: GAF domain-containing protein [Friedmanniella sp.]